LTGLQRVSQFRGMDDDIWNPRLEIASRLLAGVAAQDDVVLTGGDVKDALLITDILIAHERATRVSREEGT